MKINILLLAVLLGSCSSKGKIEYEGQGCDSIDGSKNAHIVNTSSSQSYRFTVRKTNAEASSSSTDTYVLHAGEQEYLGCTSFKLDEKIVKVKFEVVGQEEVKSTEKE